MSDIKWEEPPPASKGRGSTKWKSILAELRRNPGRWALVLDDASPSMTTFIKQGRVGDAKPGEFEARSRCEGGQRRGAIYARYVGVDAAD